MRTRFIPDWRRNICWESWHASSTPSSETVYSLYSSELQLAGRYDVRLVPSGTRESVPSQESSGSLICEIYLLESLLVKSTRTRPAFALSASFTFSRVETMLVTVAARPADKVRAFFSTSSPAIRISLGFSILRVPLPSLRAHACVCETYNGNVFYAFFPLAVHYQIGIYLYDSSQYTPLAEPFFRNVYCSLSFPVNSMRSHWSPLEFSPLLHPPFFLRPFGWTSSLAVRFVELFFVFQSKRLLRFFVCPSFDTFALPLYIFLVIKMWFFTFPHPILFCLL